MFTKLFKQHGLGVVLTVLLGLALIFSMWFFNNPKSSILGVQENQSTNRKIKIGYVPVLQGLPLFIAQNQNYFKDKNIEVETIKFESPSLFIEALASNQIDATAYTSATGILGILEDKNPGKFKVFGGSYADSDYPADFLVARSDLDIKQISDLKGKKIGTLAGPQFKALLEQILISNGLKATDSERVELPVSDLATSLKAKTVDAILGIDPAGTIAVNGGFGKRVQISPVSKAIGSPFWGGLAVVNTEFASKNQELVKDTISSFDQAIEYIKTNNIEARKIASKELNIPEIVVLSAGYQNFKNLAQMTVQDKKDIDNLFKIFRERGIVNKELKIENLLYQK